MKKSIVIAVFVLIAVVGIAVIIKFSRTDDKKPEQVKNEGRICLSTDTPYDAKDDAQAAAKIGPNETRLTCESFKKEIEDYKGVALVDIYATWCPHCQRMAPILSGIADENVGKYKITKIDAEKYQDISSEFQVKGFPTLLFFKDGKEVNRIEGETTKEKVVGALEAASK